jgi:predicted transcriptional regulator
MPRRRGKYFTTRGGLVRKSVYLPPELEKELREAAHRLERSESEMLREALREYLDRLGTAEK